MTDEQRVNYHKQIDTLLGIIAVSAIPPSRAEEVDNIREDHSWDGLSCSCGGGWLVGHAGGCPEASSARLADAVQPAAGEGGLRAAATNYLAALDSDPENDCWATETGEPEEGAERFPSDWAWREHGAQVNKALDALRAALSTSVPAGVVEDVADQSDLHAQIEAAAIEPYKNDLRDMTDAQIESEREDAQYKIDEETPWVEALCAEQNRRARIISLAQEPTR